ncbi:fumarylacetoacetate hydrolase family protein [Ramlibacter tataouinensis]|uniref:Candidate 2-keto-4-pentenoate hydratase/2-oxohepta-3-ene-1,7-dioic acid hydratase n=1 Tax=Ramlibacter tataouinensis (strain ATCC BAA-407 / DSM 14655 / LMG 21543 / TTB310) TaxID=365046 RepID=F5Y3W8_RAMTT|nr:fumarylacetoacetate hydrolase family protein [Ramlibacter tataouinensis]AEG91246.1 Candidate 2-keto-4-pentenoate hydratase/2-oxohepta-3-ene-1,7-dioic acid hydratase [Ramlibacter tataouinensis TTB310]
MSYLPRGTVYGTLLNFRSEFEALRPQMDQAPYKAPPRAPVLYVKTANTFSPHGAAIALPPGVADVEIGATLGMVMKNATEVAGCVLMNDLSLPHASFFRPPVKFKCLDGFLGVGLQVRPADPATLRIEVRINGELRQTVRFDALVRAPANLLADVAGFMTLGEGDVLLLGCDAPRPRARAGDRVELHSPALGTLSNTLVAQAS